MNLASILIVDDEPSFLRSIRRILWQEGYTNITMEEDASKVPLLLGMQQFDVILLDVTMPVIDGVTLLEVIQATHPDIPVIMLTANHSYKSAFDSIKLGAYEYLLKPPDTDRLLLTIERAVQQRMFIRERDSLRSTGGSKLKNRDFFSDIITNSASMEKVFELVEIFAPTDETVLITGETGSGKDLIAEKLFRLSPRNDKPFVVVNIAAISGSLFESELFGHEKGAFSGATSEKNGFFESADGGTIFLDEIGELPKELQGKLLRTIQYGEIYRIGNPKPVPLDIRIIAATNKDLPLSVSKGEFRADLYYRLNRGYIPIPPLRERGNDVKLLAYHFLKIGCDTFKKNITEINPVALESLQNYHFPGNVRELENIILNAVAKTPDNGIIENLELPKSKIKTTSFTKSEEELVSLAEVEKQHILNVLEAVSGNVTKASGILGISERTLQRRLKQIREQ